MRLLKHKVRRTQMSIQRKAGKAAEDVSHVEIIIPDYNFDFPNVPDFLE